MVEEVGGESIIIDRSLVGGGGKGDGEWKWHFPGHLGVRKKTRPQRMHLGKL